MNKETKKETNQEIKKERPWDKYKAANPDRTAKPWDLLNKNLRVDDAIAEERLSICKGCPELRKTTDIHGIKGTCKQCGCLMSKKVLLSNASCPIGKWRKVDSKS
jgi:hypothetical protein